MKMVGDLPLAEGVVERVVEHLRRDAEARGGVAVDGERELEPGRLLIARDIREARAASACARACARDHVGELDRVGVFERVLELRAADARVDLQVLHRLQVHGDAAYGREPRAQTLDDFVGARSALAARFQGDRRAARCSSVGLVPSEPMNDDTVATSGSCRITSARSRCRERHLAGRKCPARLRTRRR